MKYIYFNTSLTTNFKPKSINPFNNLTHFRKTKNQIFCKNLFMFLILIKYKKSFFFSKSTVFIKPFKRKIYTILRSPYRHKLARHQMILNRYDIISSIRIDTKKPFFLKNFKNLLKIFKFFKNFNMWFESNIIYNHRIKFSYSFFYNLNFNINKYK